MKNKSNFVQAKKVVSYAESDDDDEDDAFDPAGIKSKPRRTTKPTIPDDTDEEDTFIGGMDEAADEDGKPSPRFQEGYC